MSDRLDRIETLLANLAVRQEATQTQIDGLTNRIDSIASLVSDTRLTALYLLQTIENHEDRIAKIERQ